MPRTHEETEREGPAQVATAAPGAALAPPQATILALQRGAGNAAVARMLGGRRLDRLVGGNPADIPATPGAAPGTFTDTGTTHAAPGIEDASNHAAPAPAAGASVAEFGVRVLAGPGSPITGQTATEEQLFERGAPPTTSEAAGGGMVAVDEVLGSMAAPVITEAADPAIFIEGKPKADDVQQGGIGDCYDLATVIGIVNADPAKILSTVVPDGAGGATVSLYHRQETPPGPIEAAFGAGPDVEYKREAITVDNTLAFNRTGASATGTAPATERSARIVANGLPYGHDLRGARLRAAPAPKESRWWAEVVGRRLEIHRLDVYEMARWSPLLEKAGARFSEVHGQYGSGGKGAAGTGEQQGPQGYANIAGGFPGFTMTLFYGEEGVTDWGSQGGVDLTTWRPGMGGGALLAANSAAFERLLLLAGSGDGMTHVVTARALGGDSGDAVYLPRLQAAIGAAVADPDWANVAAATQGDVTALGAALTTWTAATPDPSPMPSPPPANLRSTAKAALVTAARQAADSGRNPTLFDAARAKTVKDMIDLLLVVKNMPVDWSKGSRSVYSGHEYAVLSASIVGTDGKPFAIQDYPGFVRSALYDRVDVNRSTVRMMNPHHGNTPDATGAGGDATGVSATSTGVFDVPLEQFFRLYPGVLSADFDKAG